MIIDNVRDLGIKEGDILLVASDVSKLIYSWNDFDANKFIDSLINKIGANGTLLFPTFNWDFCHGKVFDYKNTKSETGYLSNVALNRKDFVRTLHPIYSFAVCGAGANYLKKDNNIRSFGQHSPFGYLHRHNGKMIIIDLDYQNSFTFVHYVERQEEAKYRENKYFTSMYVNEQGEGEIMTRAMYVRKDGVINNLNAIGKILEQKGIAKVSMIHEVKFTLIDLVKAYDIIAEDVKTGGRNLIKYV